jgi:hypothetical protein
MPKTKSAPKKRSLEETTTSAAPTEAEVAALVEAAEIEGLEKRIADGSCPCAGPGDDRLPAGLVQAGALPTEIMEPLRALHATICHRLEGALTGWGGVSDQSGRTRGYGYLASSELSVAHHARSHAMKEYVGAAADADRAANRRASVLLADDELPPDWDAALSALTDLFRPHVPERYRGLVHPSQLVAAQPNLHNAQRFLRPHLDEPLYDGFGVVIVTVAIAGEVHTMIEPHQSWSHLLCVLTSPDRRASSGRHASCCARPVRAVRRAVRQRRVWRAATTHSPRHMTSVRRSSGFRSQPARRTR